MIAFASRSLEVPSFTSHVCVGAYEPWTTCVVLLFRRLKLEKPKLNTQLRLKPESSQSKLLSIMYNIGFPDYGTLFQVAYPDGSKYPVIRCFGFGNSICSTVLG